MPTHVMEPSTIRVGSTVDFDVQSAYIPTPAEVLMQKYGDRILQGEVLAVTDGAGGATYLALKVSGVRDLVFVRHDAVRPAVPRGK